MPIMLHTRFAYLSGTVYKTILSANATHLKNPEGLLVRHHRMN